MTVMTTLQKEEVRYFYEDEVKYYEMLFKKDCDIDLKKYCEGNNPWMIFYYLSSYFVFFY